MAVSMTQYQHNSSPSACTPSSGKTYLHDILPDPGNVGKEEESKEARHSTERAGSHSTAIDEDVSLNPDVTATV